MNIDLKIIIVCLNCWDSLCDDATPSNVESLCPCPCINSTLYDDTVTKCGQSSIANNDDVCCSKASEFVSSHIYPDIIPIPFTVNYSSVCSVTYNLPPTAYNQSLYEDISLDYEYIFDAPFTCDGCITNVTIYHRFPNNVNRVLSMQIWKKYRNTSDNSTVLRLETNRNITYSTSFMWFSIYGTVGVPDEEVCYSAGDIFGITVPSVFSELRIIKTKEMTPNSQFYSRPRPNCQSLRDVYYLKQKDTKPIIAVNVRNGKSIVIENY